MTDVNLPQKAQQQLEEVRSLVHRCQGLEQNLRQTFEQIERDHKSEIAQYKAEINRLNMGNGGSNQHQQQQHGQPQPQHSPPDNNQFNPYSSPKKSAKSAKSAKSPELARAMSPLPKQTATKYVPSPNFKSQTMRGTSNSMSYNQKQKQKQKQKQNASYLPPPPNHAPPSDNNGGNTQLRQSASGSITYSAAQNSSNPQFAPYSQSAKPGYNNNKHGAKNNQQNHHSNNNNNNKHYRQNLSNGLKKSPSPPGTEPPPPGPPQELPAIKKPQQQQQQQKQPQKQPQKLAQQQKAQQNGNGNGNGKPHLNINNMELPPGITERDFYKKYWIEAGKIGEGAFSRVRKITRKSDKAVFALKMIKKKGKSSADIQALQKEIFVLQKCDHPNIVRLGDYCDTKKRIYMVVEFCDGGDVFERVIQYKKFSEKAAIHVVSQVAKGLTHIHFNKFVHRDLKPDNLMYITKAVDSDIKIIDFGLAGDCTNGSKCTTPCGTAHYAAPEVLAAQPYEMSADIWSLGVIIYTLLCGFPPFFDASNNMKNLYHLIKKGSYSFPSPFWDEISEPAKDLIRKLLVKDPKVRLTAEQVLQHPWIIASHASEKELGPNYTNQMNHWHSMRQETEFELGKEDEQGQQQGQQGQQGQQAKNAPKQLFFNR